MLRRFAENIERLDDNPGGKFGGGSGERLVADVLSNLNTAQGLWVRLLQKRITTDDFVNQDWNFAMGDLSQLDEMLTKDHKYVDAIARLGVQWMKRAVDNGVLDAAFQLGQIYETGFCVIPMDPISSFSQYLVAASAGHANSCFCLANLFYRGIGTKMDTNKAFYYYKKAAVSGRIPEAMNSLGILLEDTALSLAADPNSVEEFEKKLLEAVSWFFEATFSYNFLMAGENLLNLILRNTWIERFYDIEGKMHVIDDVMQMLLKKVPDAQYLVEKIREEIEGSLFKKAVANQSVPLPPLIASENGSELRPNENSNSSNSASAKSSHTASAKSSHTVRLLLSDSRTDAKNSYFPPSQHNSLREM